MPSQMTPYAAHRALVTVARSYGERDAVRLNAIRAPLMTFYGKGIDYFKKKMTTLR